MPKKAKSTPPPSAANEKPPALHKAAADGNRAKVKRLLAKSKNASEDANTPTADGRTPLFYAVEGGNEGVITDLLAAKASVNATAEIEISSGKVLPGATLLHSSVLFDHPAAIDIFVSKGAKINRRSDGLTPLHLATIRDCPAAVRALIRHGANVNLSDVAKDTSLHLAAWFNHFIVADILIKNRAKLDITNESGNTPLHDAAERGSLDTAERLIEAGANINKKNKSGRVPLYIAQDEGHNKVADALLIAAGDNFRNMVAPEPERQGISEKVYDRAWRSIVAINTRTGSFGSGVIIKPGIVATNYHVIKDINDIGDIVVRTAENPLSIGKEHPYPVERIDGSDSGAEERDLCLLKVKGLKLKCPPIKIRKYHTLNIGEDVYAIGHPEGLELSLSTGIISQLRDNEHGRRIQTDAAISRGSSGGGLFDKNGNLVGITTSSIEGDESDAQNLNLAIPADWLLGYFAK